MKREIDDTTKLNDAISLLKTNKIIRYDADIAKDLAYSKGVLSDYISGKLKPSKIFLKKFYDFYQIEQIVLKNNIEQFTNSKKEFDKQGYNPSPPVLNDDQRDTLLLNLSSSMAVLVEQVAVDLSVKAGIPLDVARHRVSELRHDKLKKIESVLKELSFL